MNKVLPKIILTCFFFVFIIPDVSSFYLSWDRSIPQFLFITILNIISLCYLFKVGSLNQAIYSIYNKKIIMCYAAFVFLCFISILFAESQNAALITFPQYLSYFIAFVCIYSLANSMGKIFIKYLIYIIVFSLFIEAGSLVNNTFDLIYIREIDFARNNELLRTFSGNINVGANSIVYKLSFLFYLIYKTNNFKILSLLFFIQFLAVSSLLILMSRTSFIGLAIIILVFIALTKKKSIYKSGILIIVLLFSFLFVQNITSSTENPNEIVERVSSITLNTKDDSVNERLRYYSHALESIFQNPFFGK